MDENRYSEARQLFLDQERFTLKVRSIAVDLRNDDFESARRTIGEIIPSNQSEIDYLESQMTYVDYLVKGDQFVLATNEYNRLLAVSDTHDPLAPYTRGVLYILTDEIIRPELPEIPNEVVKRESANNGVQDYVLLAPNPFNADLEINLGDSKEATVSIINLNGVEVYRNDGLSGTEKIKTHIWSPGVYFVIIKGYDKTVEHFKIIKQ